MQSHYIYQDTKKISLKISFKNIQRSSPTRDQNWPMETQAEETNQDANLAEGFAVLTTTLNKLNLTNMPSSTKEYLVRTATLLQNRANDIRQQQLQQQDRKNNFGNQLYQTRRCVGFTGAGSCVGANRNASNHERGSPRTTILSHSRFGRGITRYPARHKKNCTMPIPCLRETWLHLLNPLRTPRIASLTPQGNMMMGLHCKIPKSLRTHIRRTRHGTIPPATQLQNHRETFTVTFLTQTTVMSTTLTTGTLEIPWTTCTDTILNQTTMMITTLTTGTLETPTLTTCTDTFLNQTTVMSTTLTTILTLFNLLSAWPQYSKLTRFRCIPPWHSFPALAMSTK
jgi:hypothetical protein